MEASIQKILEPQEAKRPEDSDNIYKTLYERAETERKELLERTITQQGQIGHLQAQVVMERRLLTERAESLIKSEAEKKELEEKLKKKNTPWWRKDIMEFSVFRALRKEPPSPPTRPA